MDSGSAVPTLSPGFNETVAVKVLTVARGRWGEDAANLVRSGRGTTGAAAAGFILMLRARFLALDKAGNRSPASTAMMAITTNSSMSVKAKLRIFIRYLVGSLRVIMSMASATAIPVRMAGF